MPLDRAAIVTSDKANLEAWQHTVKEQVTRLEQQIEQLGAARDYLNDLLRCTDENPAQCPVLGAELNG